MPNSPTLGSSAPRPETLYRVAGAAGAASGLILLLNAVKRADLVPTTAATQLAAPLAEIFALLLITGLYFAAGRVTGTLGLIATLVNGLALAGLVGVEFVINLVFAEVPAGTVEQLREGPLGIALTVFSLLFLLGSLGFTAALAVGGAVPRIPLAMYAVGAVPIALRAFVPETALIAGLFLLAAGTAWLGVWLLRGRSRPAR